MSLSLRVAVAAFSFVVLGLLMATPARAQAPTVDQMAQELVCSCGCNAVLGNCLHETCGPRDAMMAEVQQQVAQGQSKDEMLRFFVAKYGTQVLSAPPKQGFDLTAWIIPFLALIAGAALVYTLVRAWVHPPPEMKEAMSPAGLAPYEDKLKNDLEQRRRWGGP